MFDQIFSPGHRARLSRRSGCSEVENLRPARDVFVHSANLATGTEGVFFLDSEIPSPSLGAPLPRAMKHRILRQKPHLNGRIVLGVQTVGSPARICSNFLGMI